MELARIVINDIGDQQVVFLREIDGERSFPILIGFTLKWLLIKLVQVKILQDRHIR